MRRALRDRVRAGALSREGEGKVTNSDDGGRSKAEKASTLHPSSFILLPSSLFSQLPPAPAAEVREVRVREAAPAADALLLVDDLAARDAREDDEQHERDNQDNDDERGVVHCAEPLPFD